MRRSASIGFGPPHRGLPEAFFATLECELLRRRRLASLAEVRMAVFRIIEGFCDPARRHSGLGCLLPIGYEARGMAED